MYGYGVLGPRLTDATQIAAAHADESAHRALVETDAETLAATGLTPAAPLASYPLPWALTDAVAAARLAVRLEESTGSAWRFLVASSPPASQLRSLGISRLADSAVRAVRWRRIVAPAAPSTAFPGI